VEFRKSCCFIRKVEPLKRALAGNEIWITGLRSEHSPARQDLEIFEFDPGNQVIKYNPILHWTTDEVKAYINDNEFPTTRSMIAVSLASAAHHVPALFDQVKISALVAGGGKKHQKKNAVCMCIANSPD
jgi:hypothetical protein